MIYYSRMKAKKTKNPDTKKFKEKYFEQYDDIKSHTNDVYDW